MKSARVPKRIKTGVGGRLIVTFLLAGWVLCASSKEVDEGSVKMLQGLLLWNGRDFFELWVLLFECRQHGSKTE